MKQFTYTESKNNLDRFIEEDRLILKYQCPEWITKHLPEGQMMCDLFGEDKVCETIENIGLDYKSIFEVVFIENGSNVYDKWILLETKIAKSRERYTGVGKNRRFYPSVYMDAYAIPTLYRSAELGRLLNALFFSLDKRLVGEIFSKEVDGEISLTNIKVNELIKSHNIGDMTLGEAYDKLRWKKEAIKRKTSKIKLYCSSPYLIFVETDRGTIHLPLEGLIKGDKKDCDNTMLKYLYQYAYKDHEGMEELKDTPEYKVMESVFFDKD